MIQRYETLTYSTISEELDEYGQPSVSKNTDECLISISVTKHSLSDNPLYMDSEYTGITQDNSINDKCIFEYNNMKLKVLYIIKGRFNQVFLKRVE